MIGMTNVRQGQSLFDNNIYIGSKITGKNNNTNIIIDYSLMGGG